MQDEISKIENRLEKLKRPIKMDSDDDGGSDGGGRSDDGGQPSTPGKRYKPRLPRTGVPEKDSYDALMDTCNKLKNAKYYPLVDLPRVSDSELQSLASKGLVKGRKSDDGRFTPVLPDTAPPTPVRDDNFPPSAC